MSLQPQVPNDNFRQQNPEKQKNNDSEYSKKMILMKFLPLISLIILILFFSIINSQFLTVGNSLNILRQSAVLLVVACGITFILLMGSIDLSFGSIITLAGVLGALMIVHTGIPVILSILIGAVIGVLCGLINGLIFAIGKVPSFLVTLGTMFALDGIALMIIGGSPVPVNSSGFLDLTRGSLIPGIPNIILWSLIIYLIMIFIGFKTKFGRYMFAIGGGETVAKMSGVNISRYKIYGFMVSGLLAGIAGVLMASRLGSATPRMGEDLLLDGIAAVVIGGTALTGGVGGPHKTLIGVLLIAVLGNGMNISSVDPYLQIVIKGVVVVAAVAIGLDRKKIKVVK
ncbi:ABC transporter permease [Alteribacillus sp. YIM 98480]|uniref:ABC transporter permease n=1 Tax=Alteribacillus sp. YIM 98480 TaxID=2606599 RepID=UPI00131A80C8|nr:ABC transporter permease [Alteribacillus sp. YIM 98480]